MTCERLVLAPGSDNSAAIERGIETLQRSGLVAFPTDTVYGLGVQAGDERAVRRVYAVKSRSALKALPLLLSKAADLEQAARDIPASAWILAEAFWPGGLTLVLWRAARVMDWITAGSDTVAVRVPDHPLPLALIRELGGPLAATSANISGMPSPTTADQVMQTLGDTIDLLLDAGPCPGGQDSTVLDLTGRRPTILRPGAVPADALQRALGEQVALLGPGERGIS